MDTGQFAREIRNRCPVDRISGWSGLTAATKVSLPSSAYTYRLLASLTLESEIPEEIGRLDCTEEGVDV